MLQIRKPKKLGFFAMLLALLGIGGCEASEEIFDARSQLAMYGTPTATFSVKGTVKDEKGKPISNLQVILGQRYYNSASVIYDVNYVPIDTLTTDANGVYQMSKTRFPVINLQVDVNDIDGEAGGGQFESSTLVIQNIQYEGGDGWYRGKADVKVPDIKLKKK